MPAKDRGCGFTGLDATPTVLILLRHPVYLALVLCTSFRRYILLSIIVGWMHFSFPGFVVLCLHSLFACFNCHTIRVGGLYRTYVDTLVEFII